MRAEPVSSGPGGQTTLHAPTVLALRGVTVSLGPAAQVEALRGITLAIQAGERVDGITTAATRGLVAT